MRHEAAAFLVAGAGAPHFPGHHSRRRALPLPVFLPLRERRRAAGVVAAGGGHAERAVVLDQLLEHLLHRRPRRRVFAGADHAEQEHRHGVLQERRPVLDALVDNIVQLAADLLPPPRPLRQAPVCAAVVRHPPVVSSSSTTLNL
uniref:Uncharacterized protein n=1 Tax=Oryza sativa subsp. japonica TaxID=39947 RepID=Q6H5Y2_ORYSJ|nr:hypothetical protein [Oryza sativa Japonica Group]